MFDQLLVARSGRLDARSRHETDVALVTVRPCHQPPAGILDAKRLRKRLSRLRLSGCTDTLCIHVDNVQKYLL